MVLRCLFVMAVFALLLAAGCTTSRFVQEAEVYERHAGETVTEIRVMHLRHWRPVSDDILMIRTQGNQYFLIEPALPCAGNIRFARSLAFPRPKRVGYLTPFDNLLLDDQRCRVLRMWTLDYEGVRADLAAARR